MRTGTPQWQGVLGLALVALTVTGCTTATDVQGPERLVVSQIRESRDLDSIDPLKTMDTTLPTTAVFDTLLVRTGDGGVAPGLAERIERPDPRTWVLTLRDGVSFHDGTPLDAADVKATIDNVLEPKRSSSFARILAGVRAVAATGPRTVTITTTEPNALLDKSLALVPTVSSEQLARGDEYKSQLNGTGPYRLAEWSTGESVRLVRNDAYWGPAPAYPEVLVKAVPEAAGRISDLQSGTAGIAGDLDPTQRDAVTAAGAHLETIRSVRSAYLQVIPAGPLADPRVRQALYHSLDRATLARTLQGDTAEPAVSLVPADSAGFSPAFPLSDYDPVRARTLLAEAGVGGAPVDAVLDATPEMSSAAQVVAAQAREAGFALRINLVDSTTLLYDPDRATADRAPRVLLATALDDLTFDAHRPFAALLGDATSPRNYGFPAPVTDPALTDAYTGADDLVARQAASDAIHQQARAAMPAIFLYFPKTLTGVAPGVCWDPQGRRQLDVQAVRPCPAP